MSKRIKQIVISPTEEELNTNLLVAGEQVIALGIQAAPETKFAINEGVIEMGMYGTYELDLIRIGGTVTSIKIIKLSPKSGATSKIIIDMVYEDGGAIN